MKRKRLKGFLLNVLLIGGILLSTSDVSAAVPEKCNDDNPGRCDMQSSLIYTTGHNSIDHTSGNTYLPDLTMTDIGVNVSNNYTITYTDFPSLINELEQFTGKDNIGYFKELDYLAELLSEGKITVINLWNVALNGTKFIWTCQFIANEDVDGHYDTDNTRMIPAGSLFTAMISINDELGSYAKTGCSVWISKGIDIVNITTGWTQTDETVYAGAVGGLSLYDNISPLSLDEENPERTFADAFAIFKGYGSLVPRIENDNPNWGIQDISTGEMVDESRLFLIEEIAYDYMMYFSGNTVRCNGSELKSNGRLSYLYINNEVIQLSDNSFGIEGLTLAWGDGDKISEDQEDVIKTDSDMCKEVNDSFHHLITLFDAYVTLLRETDSTMTGSRALELLDLGSFDGTLGYELLEVYVNRADAQNKVWRDAFGEKTAYNVTVDSDVALIATVMDRNIKGLYSGTNYPTNITYTGLSDELKQEYELDSDIIFYEGKYYTQPVIDRIWNDLLEYERSYLVALYEDKLLRMKNDESSKTYNQDSPPNKLRIVKDYNTQKLLNPPVAFDIGAITVKHNGTETSDFNLVVKETLDQFSLKDTSVGNITTYVRYAKELGIFQFARALLGEDLTSGSKGLDNIVNAPVGIADSEYSMFTNIPNITSISSNDNIMQSMLAFEREQTLSFVRVLYIIQYMFDACALEDESIDGLSPEKITEIVSSLSTDPSKETFEIGGKVLIEMIRAIIGLHDMMDCLGIDRNGWSEAIGKYYDLYPLISKYKDNPLISTGFDSTPSYEEPLARFFSINDKSVSEDWKKGFALSALYIPMETSLYSATSVSYLQDSKWLSDFYYKYGFYRKALYISTDNAAVVDGYITGEESGRRVATFKDLLEYERDIVLYVDDDYYNANIISDTTDKLDYTALVKNEQVDEDETLEGPLDNVGVLGNMLDVQPAAILKTDDQQYYSLEIAKNCTKFGDAKTEDNRIYDEWLLSQEDIIPAIDAQEYSTKQSYAVVSAIYRSDDLYNYMLKCIATDNAIFKSSKGISYIASENPNDYLPYMNYLMLKELKDVMRNDVSASIDIDSPIYCDIFGNIVTESGLVIIPAAANTTLAGENWSPATIGFATYYKESAGIELDNGVTEEFKAWLTGYRSKQELSPIIETDSLKPNVIYITIDSPDYNNYLAEYLEEFPNFMSDGVKKTLWFELVDNGGVEQSVPIREQDAYLSHSGWLDKLEKEEDYEGHPSGAGWFMHVGKNVYRLKQSRISSGALACTIIWETLSRNSNLIQQIMYDKAYKDVASEIYGTRICNLIVEVLRGAPLESIDCDKEGIITSVSVSKGGVVAAYALDQIFNMTKGIGSDVSNAMVSYININFLDGVEYIMLYVYKITFAALIFFLMISLYTESVQNRFGINSITTFIATCVLTVICVGAVPTLLSWSYYEANKMFLSEESCYIALLNYCKNMEKGEIGVTEVTTPETTTELYLKLDNVNIPWWEICSDVLFDNTWKTFDELYEKELSESLIAHQEGVIRKADGLYVSVDELLDSVYIQYNSNTGYLRLVNNNREGSVASYASPYFVILEQLVANINAYNLNHDIQSYSQKATSSGHIITYDISAPYFKSDEFLAEGYDITGFHQMFKTTSGKIHLDYPFTKDDGSGTSRSDEARMKLSLWYPDTDMRDYNRERVDEVEEFARGWIYDNASLLGKVPDEAFVKIFALQLACKYNEVFKVPAAKAIEIINVDTKDLVRLLVGDRGDVYRNYSYSLARHTYESTGVIGCIGCGLLVLVVWLVSVLKPLFMLFILGLLLVNIFLRKTLFVKEGDCIKGYIITCGTLFMINFTYAAMLKLCFAIAAFNAPYAITMSVAIVVQILYVVALYLVFGIIKADWRNNGYNEYNNIAHFVSYSVSNVATAFNNGIIARNNPSFGEALKMGRQTSFDEPSVEKMKERERERLRRSRERSY